MKNSDNSSNSNFGSENITSGENLSVWFSNAQVPLQYSPLNGDRATDVLVVGGGISGLTTAYCLAKAGLKVILVEDGNIGSGESGKTTAHLTCALDDRYFELEKLFDEHTAQLAANSHMKAIEWIANTVKELDIDCHFKRVPGYLFLHSTDTKETLDQEYAATKRAGLITEMLNEVPSVASEE
ncbi:MAG TPA: FAD-dependent oxidoreductase, partial [Bacteroidia bacterium]|nr:FAD-dependent oxidoreductase [Bacteroidia bacterium]